jgi:tetratricopeptide (TPR) repeat protein
MKDRMMRKAAIIATIMLTWLNVYAQDRAAVIKVYNDGVRQAQANVDSAIISFENVVSMSDKVGETANDLKAKAVQVLPGLYLKSASTKLSAKKPGSEVVKAVKQAAASADKYNNTSVKENANKLLVQAYNRMATEYFTSNDLEKSLATFDSLLAINPDYAAAIYNKALIYRKQNNSDALEQTIDLYLTKLPADDQKAKQASQMALEYFRAAGSKANQADKLDEALDLLNKAAKYGQDKDLNYYFADVYNKQKKFDQGAEYAQKGLDMETGAPDAKAKFYFQLGLSQAGQGKTAEACASFKNALYGPFAEPSKAQRTNLKCQ